MGESENMCCKRHLLGRSLHMAFAWNLQSCTHTLNRMLAVCGMLHLCMYVLKAMNTGVFCVFGHCPVRIHHTKDALSECT